MKLRILSGGAAHGLVKALTPQFTAATGCEIEGTFGAVGTMRDQLLAGAPADLLVLTSALMAALAGQSWIVTETMTDVGQVPTAIAIRSGDCVPQIAGADDLRAALVAADAIYFPDPQQATAGMHFATVLARLDAAGTDAARLKTYANGATAMRALATAREKRPIGCTQATEILATPGVTLVAPLPEGFELETMYTAGVCTKAGAPDLARQFAALLTGPGARQTRQELGFV